ncbi:hypothetical protein D3C79_225810 [compost metagenome]
MSPNMKSIPTSMIVLVCTAVAVMVLAMTTGKAVSGTSMESISPLVKNAEPLNECYQDTENKPRTALAGCLEEKSQVADKEMSATYSQVESELRLIDSAGAHTALTSLAESQRTFVAFRQAECQRISDAAMGGSGAGDFQLACEVRLTRWRTDELKNM